MPTHHDETLLERYQREHLVFERTSMSEHTKGKLIVRGGFSIYAEDGKTPVADTCLTNSVPANDEANARRLVAAWNACDGVSTDNLENNLPVKELAHRYNAALAERDSLRAVNADLLEALAFYADPGDYKAPFTGGLGSLYFDCGGKARAAIAKARAVLHTDDAGEQG